MASGLVRFADRVTSGKDKLSWQRVVAGADEYPYRGVAPSLREDEYEARTVRVADFRNNFFDVGDAEANRQYRDVMECVANQWFHLIHLERFWVDPDGHRTTCHYVEWIEYYLEDGSRAHAGTGPMESTDVRS